MSKDSQPRLRVLIVDDDPDVQLMFGDALVDSRYRHEAFYADDGIEALDFLMQRHEYCDPDDSPRPDLVLLDLEMPRSDGLDVLRQMRENPTLRKIPVFMISATPSCPEASKAREWGARGVLKKPISQPELMQALQGVYRTWSQAMALPRG